MSKIKIELTNKKAELLYEILEFLKFLESENKDE